MLLTEQTKWLKSTILSVTTRILRKKNDDFLTSLKQ